MPLSTAAKAALCLCPPAVMAGTVATVPAARHAVHHLTAPHHHAARAPRRIARTPGAPAAPGDCGPAAAAPLPALPLVTYAAPIPDEPVARDLASSAPTPATAGGVLATTVPAVLASAPLGGGGGGGGGGSAGGGSSTVTNPITGGNTAAVPEPASWAMMIVGVGIMGLAWRRRRVSVAAPGPGFRSAAGLTAWGASAAVEAGDVAATAASKSALAGVAGKALMCVCPAAVAAGSVMAVPPLRHAVHAATAPALATPAPAGTRTVAPCDPGVTPVATDAVAGLPAVVSTVVSPTTGAATADAPIGEADGD